MPFSKKLQLFESLLADGEIIEVKIEGQRPIHYALAEDATLLSDLISGRIPQEWTPLGTSTIEEVLFLAPLDPVSARGRAKTLFGFDYVWEVYKPKEKRKFGYYTMPILWNEQLVARFDSKLDRETNTFMVLGFWLEDEQLGKDEAFAVSLAKGFLRFVTFLGASDLEVVVHLIVNINTTAQ